MSRVIVKNIPLYVTDKRLKDHFATCGEITDCRIQKTKTDGVEVVRRFCFVGFKFPTEAERCIKQMHQTYFDTQKICVEMARPIGSQLIARPWSKYSHGSSAHKRKNPEKYVEEEEAKRLEKKAKKAKKVCDENNGNTLLDEFLSLGKKKRKKPVEEVEGPVEEVETAKEEHLFDASVSDLDWLKKKKKTEKEEPILNGIEETMEIVEGQKIVEGSGRLYVMNIPYTATEDEVKEFFGQHGPVTSVKICNSEDSLQSRGFCYVTYVFPEHALKVLALDMPEFQGRLLRIRAATDLPPKEEEVKDHSFKKKKEKEKKDNATLEKTWNLLYMSSATANSAAATQLGIEKRDLIKRDEGDLAVTQALAETHIIQETKQWLQREGIRVEAFTRTGTSLSTCALSSTQARRKDTIIVKHLPAGTDVTQLRERFERYGALVRCALAPSRTVAVMQYLDENQASVAFKKLAFSRFLHVPMYLEWAPEDVFTQSSSSTSANIPLPEEGEKETPTIFVKNLNFKTSDIRLAQEFSGFVGFRKATIMKKKKAIAGGKTEELSMGYGFLEFQNQEQAMEVIKKKQKCMIDGHAIQLQISARNSRRKDVEEKREGGSAPVSNKLCVRNLAFEANKKELRALFSSFGTVTALRIPKKTGGLGHRGFAFLDFLTKGEALAAYEALQHTHFYGRHLVIEPAEKDAETVEELRAKQASMEDKKSKLTESRKRKRVAVLETPSAGFETMLDND